MPYCCLTVQHGIPSAHSDIQARTGVDDLDARMALFERLFTDSLDAARADMRAEMTRRLDALEAAAASRDQVVDRAIESLHTRQSDLETSQRTTVARLDVHEHRLTVGDQVLNELREFREDFRTSIQQWARMFRHGGGGDPPAR